MPTHQPPPAGWPQHPGPGPRAPVPGNPGAIPPTASPSPVAPGQGPAAAPPLAGPLAAHPGDTPAAAPSGLPYRSAAQQPQQQLALPAVEFQSHYRLLLRGYPEDYQAALEQQRRVAEQIQQEIKDEQKSIQIFIIIAVVTVCFILVAIPLIIKKFSNIDAKKKELQQLAVPPSQAITDAVSWLLTTLRPELKRKSKPLVLLDTSFPPSPGVLQPNGPPLKIRHTLMRADLTLADNTKARISIEQRIKRSVTLKRHGRRISERMVEELRVVFRPPPGKTFDPRWQAIIAQAPPQLPGLQLVGGGVTPTSASFVWRTPRYAMKYLENEMGTIENSPRIGISVVLHSLTGGYGVLRLAKRRIKASRS